MVIRLEPDSGILIATFRGALVTETSSVIFNVAMLAILMRRLYKNNIKQFAAPVISVTLAVIIVGLMFSIGQFIENYFVEDCGTAWLAWFTFFWYVAHRFSLFVLYLYRLQLIFDGTKYAYAKWVYYILAFLILAYFISGVFVYGFDYDIVYVKIGWPHGVNGSWMCSWVLGDLVSYFCRPFEFALNIVLLLLFLWKLRELRMDTAEADEREMRAATPKLGPVTPATEPALSVTSSPPPLSAVSSQENLNTDTTDVVVTAGRKGRPNRKHPRPTAKTEILFRKLTILTSIAVLSTFLVALGYVAWKPFAIFLSWDSCLNSFCAFLMFKFNHDIISPYFGTKCDRCCCFKFVGCLDCYFLDGYCCGGRDNDENGNGGNGGDRPVTQVNVEMQMSTIQEPTSPVTSTNQTSTDNNSQFDEANL